MTVTADQILPQVQAAIRALEKLPAKERDQKPSKLLVNNYNQLLLLAKEAMPTVDSRRWPPEATINTPAMGLPTSDARFTELHAFLEQVSSILAEGTTPYTFA